MPIFYCALAVIFVSRLFLTLFGLVFGFVEEQGGTKKRRREYSMCVNSVHISVCEPASQDRGRYHCVLGVSKFAAPSGIRLKPRAVREFSLRYLPCLISENPSTERETWKLMWQVAIIMILHTPGLKVMREILKRLLFDESERFFFFFLNTCISNIFSLHNLSNTMAERKRVVSRRWMINN